MELAKIEFEPIGLGLVDHNMPCAVCLKRPAVYENPGFYFGPCWGCRSLGWVLVSPPRGWLGKFIAWIGREP